MEFSFPQAEKSGEGFYVAAQGDSEGTPTNHFHANEISDWKILSASRLPMEQAFLGNH